MPEPARVRIEKAVRQRLRDGTYAPGMRLPSEIAFAREFGVSAARIREALLPLKEDGTLYTLGSRGTYVADPGNPRPGEPGSRRNRLDQSLRQRLDDHTYRPLTWLPSLRALAEEFGTSRTTVHTACVALEGEKLLRIVNGVGTFVIHPQKPSARPRAELMPRRSVRGPQQTT
ncbi:GntR family transcriptional regulator [Streptomyces sp. Qhu-G9]|uniref:GntR family transcriptional regulator n=1 Tax=Streptomyces sp. Qhu-G9 TaxID=3452799 RepID=UPI0022AC6FFA|nr:GntR family transcriptional regulator [Streptomyces aurantiacus]WAU79971.1 GntR family transcriptional regulator [Streptomyces aurantiacus]